MAEEKSLLRAYRSVCPVSSLIGKLTEKNFRMFLGRRSGKMGKGGEEGRAVERPGRCQGAPGEAPGRRR